jgi:integrase
VRITKRVVDALAPGERERWVWDDQLPGFGVRSIPSGVKTYVVQYRNAAGRTRRIALGRHGVLTPEQARRLAAERLGSVAGGRDPADEKRAATEAAKTAPDGTLAAVAERWLEFQEARLAKGKLSPSTVGEYRRQLAVEILPRLGRTRLDELTASDAQRLQDGISNRPVLANRCVALLSQVWTWAANRGACSGVNPCRSLDRFEERPREDRFSLADLAALGGALDRLAECGRIPRRIALLVRLIALTGCRPGEVKSLRWPDLDPDRHLLRLRDTKTGDRSVWLSTPALEVVRQIERVGDTPFVFASHRDPTKPVREFRKRWDLILGEAGLAHVGPYVLRHTFASESEAVGHSIFMTAELLGHSLGRRVMTRRYVHHVPAEIRAASERVGRRIDDALSGQSAGEVTPLERDQGRV